MAESENPPTTSDSNELEDQSPLDLVGVTPVQAPGTDVVRNGRDVATPIKPGTEDLICDVDRKLVEGFLLLIRDNYRKADEATFFLEQRSGVMNVPSMANMRDVLSHLVTLLHKDTPDDKRVEQLATSEEHLRRAILEPYEIALNELTGKFEELYEKYKSRLLPVKNKYTVLHAAPNAISIEASLGEINRLSSEGRAGKARNLWNPEWEKAVAAFISAFDQLDTLYVGMETHWNNYEQIQRDRKSTTLHICAISIGIIGTVLGIVFILKPSWADAIRTWLGMSP